MSEPTWGSTDPTSVSFSVAPLRRSMFALVGGCLFVLATWSGAGLFSGDPSTDRLALTINLLLLIFFATFALLGLGLLLFALRSRLTLAPDWIEVRGILRTRKLRRDELAGYRRIRGIFGDMVELAPRDPLTKPMQVELAHGAEDAVQRWLLGLPERR